MAQSKACKPIDLGGVAEDRNIEPPTSAWATGGGAVFVAFFSNILTGGVVQFGGEQAGSNTGGVRFSNADNAFNKGRPHAGAQTGPACNRVRRSDIGIGAQVYIQQTPLCAFKKHATLHGRGMDKGGCIADIGFYLFGVDCILLEERIGVEWRLLVDVG